MHYRITVDGTTADQGAFTLNAEGGRTGDLQVPLSLEDTHTVEAFAWWGPDQVADGDTRPEDSPALASQAVYCAKTPVPPPATRAPTTPTPPAASTPPAMRGEQQSGRAGASGRATQSRSATARVAVQRTCASRRARVTVSAPTDAPRDVLRQRPARAERGRPPGPALADGVGPAAALGVGAADHTPRVSITNGANARTVPPTLGAARRRPSSRSSPAEPPQGNLAAAHRLGGRVHLDYLTGCARS